MGNLIYLIIFCLSSVSTAIDLSLAGFGVCNFLVKLFGPEVELYDLGEELIHQNKKMGLWTFEDTNSTSITRPLDKVLPACTLNIMLGMETFDKFEVYIYKNPYSQTDPAHSRFILMPLGDFEFVASRFLRSLRTKVFVKPLHLDRIEGTVPWLYFCPYCISPELRGVDDLASVSTLTFKKQWKQIWIQTSPQVQPFGSCMSIIWNRTYQDDICYRESLLIDLVAAGYNVTISIHPRHDLSGFFIFKKLDAPKDFHSITFPAAEPQNLLFCPENLRLNKISILQWFSPYSTNAWLCLLASLVALLLFNLVKKLQNLKAEDIVTEIFLILRIMFRQGPNKSMVLLTLLTFALLCFSWNYENYITSELTVPPKRNSFKNLGQVIRNGYKILSVVIGTPDQLARVKEGILDRFSLGFRLHMIAVKEKHFAFRDENFDLLDFGREVQTGELIALSMDPGRMIDTNVFVTIQNIVGGRFRCAITEESFVFPMRTSFVFNAHIGHSVRKYADLLSEMGYLKIHERFLQRRFPITFNRLKGEAEEWRQTLEKQSWYQSLGKPYVPTNWYGEDTTYITLPNLISFFLIYLVLLSFASVVFIIEARCYIWRVIVETCLTLLCSKLMLICKG